jgi:hypothetical protein
VLYDELSIVKAERGWQIISKVWHYETQAGATHVTSSTGCRAKNGERLFRKRTPDAVRALAIDRRAITFALASASESKATASCRLLGGRGSNNA